MIRYFFPLSEFESILNGFLLKVINLIFTCSRSLVMEFI